MALRSAAELLIEKGVTGIDGDLLSGDEEARLVYLGVAHCIAPGEGKRMVIDIGGGSTEIIVGQGMAPLLKESLSMGCVAIAKQFFFDGKVTDKAIKKARIACLQELEPVNDLFVEQGWQEVLGASGTIKAVAKVCQSMGWSDGTIEKQSLDIIVHNAGICPWKKIAELDDETLERLLGQDWQNAENLVPVVSAEFLEEHPEVEEILNGLSDVLTTEDLMMLNAQVDAERLLAADVASDYLEEKGLI